MRVRVRRVNNGGWRRDRNWAFWLKLSAIVVAATLALSLLLTLAMMLLPWVLLAVLVLLIVRRLRGGGFGKGPVI